MKEQGITDEEFKGLKVGMISSATKEIPYGTQFLLIFVTLLTRGQRSLLIILRGKRYWPKQRVGARRMNSY